MPVVLHVLARLVRAFLIPGPEMLSPESSAFVEKLAQLPEISYLWLLILSIWGGTASYISRIRKNKMAFSVIELVGEWAISGFAGVTTALLLSALHWDYVLIAAATGIAGHMGGRAIGLLEHWLTHRFPSGKSEL